MQTQTFSILVGGQACNARCPFCCADMTPNPLPNKEPPVNWRNFRIACRLAERMGVTTAMLTGKGEPTLWRSSITKYLEELQKFALPLVELQTNGIALAHEEAYDDLGIWHGLGLTTIALSVVHWDSARNAEIYTPGQEHYELGQMVDYLHSRGFSVRLTCMLLADYVDSVKSVRQMIDFAKNVRAEQLTLNPINAPQSASDLEVANWTKQHMLSENILKLIREDLDTWGSPLRVLSHGAKVYDYGGQNVCLSHCLRPTVNTDNSVMRNLIFFPDGHLRNDWTHEGSIIL